VYCRRFNRNLVKKISTYSLSKNTERSQGNFTPCITYPTSIKMFQIISYTANQVSNDITHTLTYVYHEVLHEHGTRFIQQDARDDISAKRSAVTECNQLIWPIGNDLLLI
jgi:hypothetical protein